MLPRSTPEAQGIPSSAIEAFLNEVIQPGQDLHSFMLLRHGHVVAEGWWEPFSRERPQCLWSLSKSFCSTAVGLAVGEGRLTLGDPVIGFFPDRVPEEIGDNLKAMKVEHLLSMSCGHDPELQRIGFRDDPTDWRNAFLAHPVPHVPGTHFLYNSVGTYMCSAIVQEVTGQRILDYLTPRLFEPLGINGATWEQDPAGIDVGGWGLRVRTEDIAKFGQLYLQDGVWEGKRILPEGWVANATRAHVSNAPEGLDPSTQGEWGQGYGFQFWRCRHNAYRGDGAFGQFCVVMPEQDAVLVMTSCLDELQLPMDAAWKHLLPAMGEEPLPESAASQSLSARLTGQKVARPASKVDFSDQTRNGTYVFEDAEGGFDKINLAFGPSGDSFVWSGPSDSLRLTAGRSETRTSTHGDVARAAVGAWVSETRYELRVWFLDWTGVETYAFEFEGDGLRLTQSVRGWFDAGPPTTRSATRMA